MKRLVIEKENWDKILDLLTSSYQIYAAAENEYGRDYELLTGKMISRVIYNHPQPATPLKNFFLPVRENISVINDDPRQRIIMGIPNCDLEGLGILDEIYLHPEYNDPFYRIKRENTILITSDCFSVREYCHCTTYGIQPFSSGKGDLSLALLDGMVILTAFSGKGLDFAEMIRILGKWQMMKPDLESLLEEKHQEMVGLLTRAHSGLPDYHHTGELVKGASPDIWKRYAAPCVSCGACAVICPTCSCFLLIDKPDFEKVKQQDACQYPGFARVAGGEDAMREKHIRFRNRYMCKYVWKPERFSSLACTGCGRCIEACIGGISKNELFLELTNHPE
jgi:ferredoxin